MCEGQVRAIVMVSGHVSLSCLSVWSMSVESSVTLFSRTSDTRCHWSSLAVTADSSRTTLHNRNQHWRHV